MSHSPFWWMIGQRRINYLKSICFWCLGNWYYRVHLDLCSILHILLSSTMFVCTYPSLHLVVVAKIVWTNTMAHAVVEKNVLTWLSLICSVYLLLKRAGTTSACNFDGAYVFLHVQHQDHHILPSLQAVFMGVHCV